MEVFDQPGRFRKCPTYMPRETAQGYLGRLATFFGAKNPKQFCKDYMLDLTGIQHGEPEALRRLAAMTGADVDEMIRCTPKRINNAFMELNGQVLHTRVNPRYKIRICPLCAKEDIAANPGMPIDQAVHMRCDWTIGVVGACHRHGIELATYLAPYRTTEQFDVGYETVNLLEELDRLPIVTAEIDDFQRYVLSRIGAIEPIVSPLLDDLPLVTVTQLCHAAGLDLLQRRSKDTPSDTERRAAGFEMIGQGQAGLDAVIVEMRHGMTPAEMATRIMPRLLEYIHESIAMARNLGDFTDLFAATLFRLLPYVPGQVVLGRKCLEASLYHFREARRVYGIQASHLHAFIEGVPELAMKSGPGQDNYLVDRRVADALFLGRTPFVTGMDIVRFMGREKVFARRVLGELADAGIIRTEEKAVRNGLPPIYSMPDTQRAVQAFIDRFESVDPNAPGMVGIDAVTSAYGVKSKDLWRHLASGKIKKLGMAEGEGFLRGMRLDLAEVLSVVAYVENPMTVRDVGNLLRTRDGNVRNLAANRYLVGAEMDHLPSGIVHVFARAHVEAFHAEYISSTAVRAELGSSFEFGVIVGRGLEPAILLEGLTEGESRTTFYRRSEYERLRK